MDEPKQIQVKLMTPHLFESVGNIRHDDYLQNE